MKHLFEKTVIVFYFVLLIANVKMPVLFHIGIIGLSVYLLIISIKELVDYGRTTKEKN